MRRRPLSPKDAPSEQTWRDYLQALPPDQKEKLAENLRRWQALTPEEREFLRQKAAARHEKMRQAAAAALAQSGLTLSPAQQEAYVGRYLEGRGEIERPLRQEMQRERKPMLEDMKKKLNEEFSSLPPVSGGKNQEVAEKYSALAPAFPTPPQPFQRMEIDRAMKQSGLDFDDDRRKFYGWRYIQLRKKIEEHLRAEMETKRKPQLDALAERLKAEFTAAPQKTGSTE